MAGILVVEQDAGAVHSVGHRGGGVGEHRHLLIERLDKRNTESFVLAGAQEEVRDVVVRHQLFI